MEFINDAQLVTIIYYSIQIAQIINRNKLPPKKKKFLEA